MSELQTTESDKAQEQTSINEMNNVRFVLGNMINSLNNSKTKSRERSLVVTKLQEASMWAQEALIKE